MNNIFLYAGDGVPLRKVASSTGNGVSGLTTIPDGGFSETFSGSDCKELILLFKFDVGDPPLSESEEATIAIEQVIDSTASVAGEDYETVTVTTEQIARFNAGKALTGNFRVRNDAGRGVTAYLQKRIL